MKQNLILQTTKGLRLNMSTMYVIKIVLRMFSNPKHMYVFKAKKLSAYVVFCA